MPSLRSKPSIDDPFRRNEKVKATRDLPGIPAGTIGRVKLIDGFRWTRYWVFFDNGAQHGSLDDTDLVRPEHWDEYFERAKAKKAAAEAKEATGSSEGGGDAAAGAAIDPSDPNAALLARVPPDLLARSAAARERLGVPKP